MTNANGNYVAKHSEDAPLDTAKLQVLVESISEQVFSKPFLHKAIFNPRLRSTGGRYHLSDHHLDFNPKVYERYGMPELIQVIKHELCHYHLHIEGKGYQHKDVDFKNLLLETGGSRYVRSLIDQTTENYRQYECQKCHTLILRKRKINTSRFSCKCGGKLKLISLT